MKFRSDINGLRGVAVIAVILSHAGLPLRGGFLGVDLFFVISGFLITGILLKEFERGVFSYWGFYERRARRILPLLFVVCTVSGLFAWQWLPTDQFKDFGQSVAAIGALSSNYLFLKESGYFESLNSNKPLLHTWSLAIEEQFYVLIPVLLRLWWVLRRDPMVLFLIVLVGSFVSSCWLSRVSPDAAFYLLPTRAWELCMGGLCACLATKRSVIALGDRYGPILVGAALVGIFASFICIKGQWNHPGLATLPVVLGAGLLMLFGARDSGLTLILRNPLMQRAGLISFSLYMWHQPILALGRLRFPGSDNVTFTISALFLTWFCSELSWRVIETPFRRARSSRIRTWLTPTLTGLCCCVAFGVAIHANGGLPGRLKPAAALAVEETYFKSPTDCEPVHFGSLKACAYGDPRRKTAVLIGDSHAMVLAPSLGRALREEGLFLVDLSKGACNPFVKVSDSKEGCSKHNQAVWDELGTNKSIDYVIISMRWSAFLTNEGFDNGKGGIEQVRSELITDMSLVEKEGAIASVIQSLVATKRHIVLISDVPEMGWNVPMRIFSSVQFDLDIERPVAVEVSRVLRRTQDARRVFETLRALPSVRVVDPQEAFCDTNEGLCIGEEDGRPLYIDGDHLSSLGAAKLATLVSSKLVAISNYAD